MAEYIQSVFPQNKPVRYKVKGLSFKSGDGLIIGYDNQIILERIGRIIMTKRGERLNNPTFGTELETYIFERGNILKQHVDKFLKNAIESYEPRVKVLSIDTTYQGHEAEIKVEVYRVDTNERLTFDEILEIEG